MKIVILGAGNVGTNLQHAFALQKINVELVPSRPITAGTSSVSLPGADVYIYAVADNALEDVIAHVDAPKALHLHTSGSAPITVFGDDKPHAGVLYFFQSFSKNHLIDDWSSIPVFIEGKNIDDVLNMTISEAIQFFGEYKQKTIVSRLKPLEDVGLGYIKLGQNSSTLSGGENQRVKLAYFIGQEKQEPTLFIFDEPTTGLHFHDIERLLRSFNALIERGHTILIIEHNMEVIKCADHVIDLGPDGGDRGGQLVVCGTPEEIALCEQSITGKYLKEKLSLPRNVNKS